MPNAGHQALAVEPATGTAAAPEVARAPVLTGPHARQTVSAVERASGSASTPSFSFGRLAVTQPGDAAELAADRLADRLAQRPDASTDARPSPLASAPSAVWDAVKSPGRPLASHEHPHAFGLDLSSVRVHTGGRAGESARALGAAAYALGDHIVLGAGYEGGSPAGRRLLAHELAHVANARRLPEPVVQRQGYDDELYLADPKWAKERGLNPHLIHDNLKQWAIIRGRLEIESDSALMRMQEKDGAESDVADDVYLLLLDLLWGQRSIQQRMRAHERTDRRENPELGGNRRDGGRIDVTPLDVVQLSALEGSDDARGRGVDELNAYWPQIQAHLVGQARERMQNELLDAVTRTPKRTDLEESSETIAKIRHHPYRDTYTAPVAGFGSDHTFRPGQRYSQLYIKDLYAGGIVTAWFYVEGFPLWYYRGDSDILDRNTFQGEVARGVAESAKFAGMLLPLMIKVAGLVLSFSPTPAALIAGVLLDQLGEEGLRDLEGRGRSASEIAGTAVRDILVGLAVQKIFNVASSMKSVGEWAAGTGRKSLLELGEREGTDLAAGATAKLASAAEAAANKGRQAVMTEIERTEGPLVASALEGQSVRSVEDAALREEGFQVEVEIQHSGGRHVYRGKLGKDGWEWCRWSARVCELKLGSAVDQKAAEFRPDRFRVKPYATTDADVQTIRRTMKKMAIPSRRYVDVKKYADLRRWEGAKLEDALDELRRFGESRAERLVRETSENLPSGQFERFLEEEAPVLSTVDEEAAELAGAKTTSIPRPPRHHALPQKSRAWFKRHKVDIDRYTLELDEGVHQALHGGGDWKLAMRVWKNQHWNARIMKELQAAEKGMRFAEGAGKGRLLTEGEILTVTRRVLADFQIHVPEGEVELPYIEYGAD